MNIFFLNYIVVFRNLELKCWNVLYFILKNKFIGVYNIILLKILTIIFLIIFRCSNENCGSSLTSKCVTFKRINVSPTKYLSIADDLTRYVFNFQNNWLIIQGGGLKNNRMKLAAHIAFVIRAFLITWVLSNRFLGQYTKQHRFWQL